MPTYYVLDEHKNLVEALTKEQFLGILEQAIEDGDLEGIDENTAVASKLRSVLNGTTHQVEFVTQAQYNTLVANNQLVAGCYYHITDDTTAEDLESHMASIDEAELVLAQELLRVGGEVSGLDTRVTALENNRLYTYDIADNADYTDQDVSAGLSIPVKARNNSQNPVILNGFLKSYDLDDEIVEITRVSLVLSDYQNIGYDVYSTVDFSVGFIDSGNVRYYQARKVRISARLVTNEIILSFKYLLLDNSSTLERYSLQPFSANWAYFQLESVKEIVKY